MYFLEIKKENKDFLGSIRHWENLKIAFEANVVWVKDFLAEQINTPEIQQIPYKKVYELKENLLFEQGNLLPSKKLPSGLLWTPILRALPVSLPKFNHNFFGIDEKLEITIKTSQEIKEAYALLVNYDELKLYIETVPKYRLEPLQWVVLDNKALILGNPLLPIKGKTYWLDHDFLLPTGYNFEWFALTKKLQEELNLSKQNLILWNKDNSYSVIPKTTIKQLSISSFRLTFS
ncbi:hypothetical protein [Flavobacterium sp. ov086]|uniref:hypothetical protein n=1 Tax=Flavobacterium sp. ov086 TaxID=1761785 RepID=UPI000B64A102|nr:hypothetical protein [Flavobacterium sp. ov086]SNR57509.1 hypothetical protein SAMN04487979_11214 [Flavobacterium sp. ov086]